MKISELKNGMRARVTANCCKCDLSCRLSEMGLVVGTEFHVTKIAPLGDPIEIEFRNQRLCIRKKECSDVEVEVIQ